MVQLVKIQGRESIHKNNSIPTRLLPTLVARTFRSDTVCENIKDYNRCYDINNEK